MQHEEKNNDILEGAIIDIGVEKNILKKHSLKKNTL